MMKTYSAQELKDIQNESILLAKHFVSFCQDHDLLCYLCGGGLIGTIRHHGFIPWDDDLDFFMPRRDYQKLIDLWDRENQDKHFHLLISSPNFRDHNNFVTIRDDRTALIKPYQQDLDIVHGVNLDIFPLDGCPEGRWQRKKQIFCAMLHSLYRTETVPVNHGKIIELCGRTALALVPSEKCRIKIWMWAERKMSQYSFAQCKYATELCAGPAYWHNVYQRDWFASSLMMPFEDTKMPVPVGYDPYLRMAFGDYMKLPKEEDRHPQHDSIVLDVHQSYKEYLDQYGSNRKQMK
jgi:lipopolysaccharide cholinephosphotransferase